MARPPGSLATARMNAPVLPSSSQSRMSSAFPGGLLMTTSTASMPTTTSTLAASQNIPGTVPAGAGGMLRPPMMPGLGQPQFGVPSNMAGSNMAASNMAASNMAASNMAASNMAASATTASSMATGINNALPTSQQAVPVTNVVPSNINTVTGLPGQPMMPGQLPGQPGFIATGPGGQVLKNAPVMMQQGKSIDFVKEMF